MQYNVIRKFTQKKGHFVPYELLTCETGDKSMWLLLQSLVNSSKTRLSKSTVNKIQQLGLSSQD